MPAANNVRDSFLLYFDAAFTQTLGEMFSAAKSSCSLMKNILIYNITHPPLNYISTFTYSAVHITNPYFVALISSSYI